MMTTQQNTKLYKVVFENLNTNKLYTEYVEATSSDEAGQMVLKKYGPSYDLVKSISVKPSELS